MNKTDSLNSYVWKSRKVKDNNGNFLQDKKKLIDMSEYELNVAYDHCKNMLYNNSKMNPGRYLVLTEVNKQIEYCGAELAVRYFCQLTDENDIPKYTRFSLINEIKTLVNVYRNSSDSTIRLQDIYDYTKLPRDFRGVPVETILKACTDSLGEFNKKPITKSFIIKQGIWFTPLEIQEFTEISKAKTIGEKLTIVKDRLGLTSDTEIPINASGLSYNQFRSMIGLKPNKKYSELSTVQLETLRNKILFVLEEEVYTHIKRWETLMAQMKEVAEFKGFRL